MLRVENLHTAYGELEILHGVNLKVSEGGLVILLGPNGHGKSTLLKTICGLLQVTKGEIYYRGEPISDWSTEKRVDSGLIYVAEERYLFPQMTVLENLQMGAYLKRARIKEQANLQFTYRLFPELKTKKKQLASTLSGGQARMLTIGRGLMSDAHILAIDEPTLGLSPLLRQKVYSAISEINQQGKTILLVEQNRSELLDAADRIYCLEEGQIVFSGKNEKVLSSEHFRELFLGRAM